MRIIWIGLAALALCAPAVSQAGAKTIICEGCGETEYTKIALQAAEDADTVYVVDGANGNLRKYRISESGDREVTRLKRTATRIEPTTQEWTQFDEMLQIYDQISYSLDSCGPGGAGDYLVPDLNVEWACEQHDACYQHGGTSSDRSDCDQQLYDDMVALGALPSLAAAYYLAVRAAGWLYFNYTAKDLDGDGVVDHKCAYLEVCDYTDYAEFTR